MRVVVRLGFYCSLQLNDDECVDNTMCFGHQFDIAMLYVKLHDRHNVLMTYRQRSPNPNYLYEGSKSTPVLCR